MKKRNLVLLGVALGAVAVTAYRFMKNYQEVAPVKEKGQDNEDDFDDVIVDTGMDENKRTYIQIDMDAAKEAAKMTVEDFKEGAETVIKKTQEVSKKISDKVIENYGEQINEVKEKATKTYEEAKIKATKSYEEAKEKALNKYEEVKKGVTDYYNGYFKKEEPEEDFVTEDLDSPEVVDSPEADVVVDDLQKQADDFIQNIE